MAKELDRAGVASALITTLVPLARSVGANRIVAGKAIPHPVGDPTLSREQEKEFRKEILQRALKALQTEAGEQLIL